MADNKVQITLEAINKFKSTFDELQQSIKALPILYDQFGNAIKRSADESKKAFDEMKKGPEAIKGPLVSLGEGWLAITAKVAVATAAFYAAKRMIYDTAREIASAGNDIQRMSRTLNMSTDDFQKWSYVAKIADIDMGGFGEAIKSLTRSMSEALQGSGDAAKAFNILGINLKDTTGKTKDQQTVMMETIGALEKYGDGVNRDALMLAIFVRGWMSIKPLIDQGTKAIEENRREAERWNLILGKDIIKSLSESEDSFKRWSMTWKITKMEVLEPFVVILGSILERTLALKKAWSEGGISGVYREVLAGQEEARIEHLSSAAWTKEWVAGWKPPATKSKPEAPGLPTGKSESDTVKEIQAAIDGVLAAEELRGQIAIAQHELAEGGWSKEKDIVEQVRDEIANLDRVTNEWGEVTLGRQELVEAGWAAVAKAEEDEIHELLELRKLEWEDWKKENWKVSQMEIVWDSLGQNISDVWAQNVTNIVKGAENAREALRNIFTGMADAFISAVAKMIMQWLLFETITSDGKTNQKFLSSGSGIGAIIGVIGKAVGLQEGGQFWVNRPTPLLVGEGGQREFVSVTPESKMGGAAKGTIINHNETFYLVQAVDQESVSNLLRRSGATIIKIAGDDIRSFGMLRNAVKGS
jgi:uncharacterized protein YukE